MNPQHSDPAELRFDCPACHATLAVPVAAAGVQGPCPKCWQEIISPDPANNLVARLPAPAPAPPVETPPPVESVPPAPPQESAPGPRERARVPEENVPGRQQSVPGPAPRRSRVPRLAGLLITALVFGSIGYFIGAARKEAPGISQASGSRVTVQTSPPGDTTPEPEPPSPPNPPAPETSAAPAPDAPPPDAPDAKPSSPPHASGADRIDRTDLAPEAALRAFLNASGWKQRATHVLWPDRVAPMMEKYAAEHGDGPIPYESIEFTDGDGGNRFFQVFTKEHPDGFPVAVIATEEGPKIEWETFIGFRDDHFRRFLEGPVKKTGTFDLLIWPAEQRQAGNSWLYRLRAPMPGRETVAYARKDVTASARLVALFNGADGIDKQTLEEFSRDGVPIALKLAKRSMADGRSYIEILEVISVGWISGEP